MAKPESKKGAMAFVAGRPAAAPEDQVNNGSLDPSPSSGSHDTANTPVPANRSKSGKQTSKENLSRRTTESEVYDDGTNTFFW